MVSEMNIVSEARRSYNSAPKMVNHVKKLAEGHCLLGVIMLFLAATADYLSSRNKTIRLSGLEECCSFYFLLTGIIGLAGCTTSRRGLIAAFLLMCLHSIFIFVPGIVIASSFDIHFYQHECWGSCDWHLLNIPTSSRCQILCGEGLSTNQKGQMTRLGTDVRVDAVMIALAIFELLFSIVTVIASARLMCLSDSRLRDKVRSELQPLNEMNAVKVDDTR
ncbi:hypothetical protein PFISCL1PPCAC_24161, partial [Pristionchus fissidentatus]